MSSTNKRKKAPSGSDKNGIDPFSIIMFAKDQKTKKVESKKKIKSSLGNRHSTDSCTLAYN